MIANIIDRRKRKYRFRKVNAVVEATWHDNTSGDADKLRTGRGKIGPNYEEQEHTSVHEAIEWARKFPTPVTLYLYDKDGGIYAAKTTRRKKKASA